MTKIEYYMKKERQSKVEQSRHSFLRTKALKTTIVDNGIILPAHTNPDKLWADGGVIDDKGNFVKASSNGYLFGGKYDHDGYDKSNKEVIFFGPFISHWGHFICDLIGRMWYIKENPQKYKIAYCGWNWHQDEGNIEGNFLELLELLGCHKSQFINIQKPTKFKKIIIPDLAFSGGNYYTKEFEKMISIIVKNALKNSTKTPKKIYFSRTKFNNGKERGEEKIENIFKTNGYQIVYPESLSVKEQINYLNNAEQLAMVSGSLSHNLMFTKSEHLQAIILNKMDLINNYQLVIDDMTKANLTYIDSFFNLREVLFGMGPFLLCVSKYFKRFLKENNYTVPKNTSLTLRDIAWYFKKYHETYSTPERKKLLQSQKESMKAVKANS